MADFTHFFVKITVKTLQSSWNKMFFGKIAIKSRMTNLNTFMPPNRFLHQKKNVNEETFKGEKAEREGEG